MAKRINTNRSNGLSREIQPCDNYHAHVYFDETTKDFAAELCRMAGDHFPLKVGRVHERLVGPHPKWSCQLAFEADIFDELIGWLDENRKQLTVFVHGLTGDDLADHTNFTAWLGEEETLNLAFFKKK